jgi:hypothetical protein
MARLGIVVAGLALVVGLFARDSAHVLAQPVATIALPEPGETKELYAGCNLISVTFPDDTATEDVIDAVTPAETVQALWRQTPALDRFEGFSPAFPQASDLLRVDFLEAVWLCIGPPSPGFPTPTPALASTPPAPAPTPGPQPTADLAITQLFATSSPAGGVRARITNNGPDTVSLVAQLSCSAGVNPYGMGIPYGHGVGLSISIALSPGQTGEFATGISVDTSEAWYDVACTVQVDSNDPNLANNRLSRVFPTSDLAITDIFPQSLPHGESYVRITNNGPDSLTDAEVSLACSALVTDTVGAQTVLASGAFPITVSLNPGQTKEFITLILVNNDCAEYDMKCDIKASFNDPNTANDSYSEVIPLSSGGDWQCPY